MFLNIALYYFVPVLFSPFSIPITLLGIVRANLSAFHTFVQFALISFLLFPHPLCVCKWLCFVVYSTGRFILNFILWYFVLVFLSHFSIAITLLGEERHNLSAFHTFVRFALVWFLLFSLPLLVWKWLRL